VKKIKLKKKKQCQPELSFQNYDLSLKTEIISSRKTMKLNFQQIQYWRIKLKKKSILQKDLIKKTAIKIKRTKFKIKGNLRGKLIVLDWMVK